MDRKKAERALRELALREGVSVDHIRKKIQEAIDLAMADPHPQRKMFWAAIPHQGPRPSPEDLLCFLGEHADILL